MKKTYIILEKAYEYFKKYWYPIAIVIVPIEVLFYLVKLLLIFILGNSIFLPFMNSILSIVINTLIYATEIFLIYNLITNEEFNYKKALIVGLNRFIPLFQVFAIVFFAVAFVALILTSLSAFIGKIFFLAIGIGALFLFSVPYLIVLEGYKVRDAFVYAPEKNQKYIVLILATLFSSAFIIAVIAFIIGLIFKGLSDSYIFQILILIFMTVLSIYPLIATYLLYEEIKMNQEISELLED